MKSNHFLDDIGVIAVEDFFDRNFCKELCEEIKKSESIPTPLPDYEVEGIDYKTNNKRPRIVENLSIETNKIVCQKFEGLMPQLEKQLDIELDSILPPYLSIYEKNTFLGKHADGADKFNGKKLQKVSKLQSVVFLNDQKEKQGMEGFEGGVLTIYGFTKSDLFSKFGYPINAKAGKLIVFPAKLLHEVTPITNGTRYTLNTSYF